MFYPSSPPALRAALDAAYAGARDVVRTAPVAVVAPHAGYVYSGPIAATAYRALRPLAGTVTRVVLLGPSHYVPFDGVAVPSVDAFATPLGDVRVDAEARARVLGLSGVVVSDEPHANEHSLEVQLPFIIDALGDVPVLPVAVGRAGDDVVAALIDALWDGPSVVPIVSTDLSHYLNYDEAALRDHATAAHVEAGRATEIGPHDACGYRPLRGLMVAAGARGRSLTAVDLRSSGDTAGDRDRVVGYGAFVVA
jgi:AmmeMemoRadiSam system protein B